MAEIDSKTAASWKNLDWLRHGFSTRQGGASTAYGGQALNLGWTKEDGPAHVRQNRRAFVDAVSQPGGPMRLVTIRQVHSGVVRVVGEEAFQGTLETAEGKAVLEGDGLVTNLPGVLIAVGTADCVPVLVVDPIRRAVGAFHAGWRGTVAGIVEQGIALMQQQYGSQPGEMLAAVGPSIGACCYAVGEEVREQFASRFHYAQTLFASRSNDGTAQLYVDLWQANRHQLIDAGVASERIIMIGECTACARTSTGERRYFSHRAEHGVAGRMLNAIGLAR